MRRRQQDITDLTFALLILGAAIAALGLVLGTLETVSLKDSLRIFLAGIWIAAGAVGAEALAARKFKATAQRRGAPRRGR